MNHISYQRAASLLAALCAASGLMLIVAAGMQRDVWGELSHTKDIDNGYVLGAVRSPRPVVSDARVHEDSPMQPAVDLFAWSNISPEKPEEAIRFGSYKIWHYLSGTPSLEAETGTVLGPSGKETWYNMDMTGVIDNLRAAGIEGEYGVREDGVKTYGDYIMCAADYDLRPFGTILETSLGTAIVCDTGDFIYENPYQLDIAVTWQ